LLFTHYIGLALVAVQALYVLLFLRGRQRMTAIAGLSVIGVIVVAWFFAVIYGQTNNVGTGFNVPSTLASLWAWRIHWLTQQWALLGGLAVLGIIALVSGEATPRPYSWTRLNVAPASLLLAWLIAPIAGAYILNFETPILM